MSERVIVSYQGYDGPVRLNLTMDEARAHYARLAAPLRDTYAVEPTPRDHLAADWFDNVEAVEAGDIASRPWGKFADAFAEVFSEKAKG